MPEIRYQNSDPEEEVSVFSFQPERRRGKVPRRGFGWSVWVLKESAASELTGSLATDLKAES